MKRVLGARALSACALAALVVVAGGAAPASAGWEATASAPSFELSTGSLGSPGPVVCQNRGGPLLDLHVRLSWSAVSDATAYDVVLVTPPGTPAPVLLTVSASDAQNGIIAADVRAGLLNNVIRLITGNPTVAVVARHGDWTSPASAGKTLIPSGLVSGLLGGLRCPN
ncbi:hypothetical protein [Microbacterium testaceum]|uniref:hypothetical protein n=1 Tax=Microbacterium testaceum TaxID=2033 RepID=UPI0012448B15|nr:hypothetical protein [Microbacterium testaceum]